MTQTRVGSVASVNPDGTVNLWLSGEMVPSIACAPAYSPRAVGDRVAVEIPMPGLMRVAGIAAGAPVSAGAVVRVAPSAPYEEATVYVDPATAEPRYLLPPIAAPAPGTTGQSGVLRVPSLMLRTYRDGRVFDSENHARQGSWDGYGPDVGIALYSAASLAPLTGKTLTSLAIEAHRADGGGVVGEQPVTTGLHTYTSLPDSTPTLTDLDVRFYLARNEITTPPAIHPAAWASTILAGGGVGVSGAAWVDLDQIDLLIGWSD